MKTKMHPMEKSSSSTSQQEQRSSQEQLLQQPQPPQSPSSQQQPLQTRHDDAPDNISNFSRSSYNFGSTMSAPSPECESNSTPVSVRDMIRRYNSASKMDSAPQPTPLRRQSQYTLNSSRSSFFGINKFSAQSNGKREESDDDAAKPTRNYCRRCSSCKKYEQTGPRLLTAPTPERLCSRKAVRCNSSGGESEGNCQICTGDSMRKRCSSCELNESKELPNSLKVSASKERCPRSSVDSMEEVTCQPVEASYQSKTTIAKTSSGVRIIIDIFFDQDQNVAPSDVIGSRVETDIPQSRILSEFQQQSVQHQAARLQN